MTSRQIEGIRVLVNTNTGSNGHNRTVLEERDAPEAVDGGASSVERWGSVPLCTFDPETGLAINPKGVDELRWYHYLSHYPDWERFLLESDHD